jgi:uncharacterized membrane protein YfcA
LSPQPDFLLVSLGLLVGTLVGLTGVGGGSLLTPLLILMVGIKPTLAIGTDLAFAALTKLVGAVQHVRNQTVDVRLTLWLALGSVPGALAASALVTVLETQFPTVAEAAIGKVLGIALLLAAAASLLRASGVHWSSAEAGTPRPVTAVLLGLGVGVLVGLTSIGAGSLLMAVFALLYALPAGRAVGTDVLHGAVLAAVAAIAHGAAGRIDVAMLGNLLVGSVPGVLIGGWLCARLPGRPLRVGIAVVLAMAGARLL